MISEVLIRAQKCPLYLFLKYANYQKVNNIRMYLVKLLTLVCSYVSFYYATKTPKKAIIDPTCSCS